LIFGNTVRPLGPHHLVRLELSRSSRRSRSIVSRNVLPSIAKASRNPYLNLIGQGYFLFEEWQPVGERPKQGFIATVYGATLWRSMLTITLAAGSPQS